MIGFEDEFEVAEENRPKFKYSPILRRGLAMGIDFFICTFIVTIYFMTQFDFKDNPNLLQDYILQNKGYTQLIIYIAFFLYFIFLESSNLKASLGKLIFGIKVTDESGDKLHHTQVAKRTLVKSIAFSPIILIFYVLIINVKRQFLHDMWAKSIVILNK